MALERGQRRGRVGAARWPAAGRCPRASRGRARRRTRGASRAAAPPPLPPPRAPPPGLWRAPTKPQSSDKNDVMEKMDDEYRKRIMMTYESG